MADHGAAAVEFAIVLLPLLVLAMAAIDWGFYFHFRHVVTNAAREGARFAATLPPRVPGDRSSCVDGTRVEARVNDQVRAALNRTAGAITVACPIIAGTSDRAVGVTVQLGAERFAGAWSFVPASIQIQVQMRWE